MECSPESETKEAAQLGETDGEGRGESKRLKEEKSVEAMGEKSAALFLQRRVSPGPMNCRTRVSLQIIYIY